MSSNEIITVGSENKEGHSEILVILKEIIQKYRTKKMIFSKYYVR